MANFFLTGGELLQRERGVTHVYFGLHFLVALLGNLEISLLHVTTLFRVERICDGAEHKHV